MMDISNETDPPSTDGACNVTDLKKMYSLAPYDVALHVVSIMFGLPIHIYIVNLIVKGTGRGIASEFFTLHISICEIIFYLRSMNTVLSVVFTRLYVVRMFLSGFVTTARLFQCLICVERYLAVVHPMIFLKFKPLRYKVACSCFIWMLIIIFCLISLELSSLCSMRVFKCLYLLQYLVFLIINLFCCLAVLRALKKPRPGERVKEREEENRMKRRAFYIILINTVTLILTYVPSSITALQYVLSVPASQELESLGLTCFFLPGFVQPILFIHRVGKLPFCKSP